MTSPPFDSTHGRQRRAWHDIAAFGQHTRSDDVGLGMPSSPLGSTHSQTTLGVACHHSPWMENTVKRRQSWNDTIAFGQHIQSNDVRRGMPSSPLGTTQGQQCRACHDDITALGQQTRLATSSVACHHRLRALHTVERRRAWHAIIAFRQHKRSNDVRRGIPSSPLD